MKKFVGIFSIFLVILILACFFRAAFGMPNVYIPEIFAAFETFRFTENLDFSSPEKILDTLPLALADLGQFVQRFVNSLFPFLAP